MLTLYQFFSTFPTLSRWYILQLKLATKNYYYYSDYEIDIFKSDIVIHVFGVEFKNLVKTLLTPITLNGVLFHQIPGVYIDQQYHIQVYLY